MVFGSFSSSREFSECYLIEYGADPIEGGLMLAVRMFLKDLQTFWCPVQPLKLPKELIDNFENSKFSKTVQIFEKCIRHLVIFRKFRKFRNYEIFYEFFRQLEGLYETSECL